MTSTAFQITDRTTKLLSNYEDDFHCIELLQFFSKHPHTRFSQLALVHAIDNGKLVVIEKALKRLVQDGLVNEHSDKIVALYSLIVDK